MDKYLIGFFLGVILALAWSLYQDYKLSAKRKYYYEAFENMKYNAIKEATK